MHRIAGIIILFFFLASAGNGHARSVDGADTLSCDFYFPRGSSSLDASFGDNGASLVRLRMAVDSLGPSLSSIYVRASASPEGPALLNWELSAARAQAVEVFLTDSLDISPFAVHHEIVGGEGDPLTPELFPRHRKASVTLSFQDTAASPRDTVYVQVPVYRQDTIFVAARETPPITDERTSLKKSYVSGKRMLLAVRTNALALPLLNMGVEVPLGRHWSLGADYYYPWLWRPRHGEGIDYSGSAFELLALDLEARYWFGRRHSPSGERLLGHSLGIYSAVGYYDFERNASGYQGEFLNVGVDWLYACPIFGGRMHLEFELGVGYIYSVARPYDCFEPGGKCFAQSGVRRYVRWWGPTRAQVSLVVPVYVGKKGGAK